MSVTLQSLRSIHKLKVILKEQFQASCWVSMVYMKVLI